MRARSTLIMLMLLSSGTVLASGEDGRADCGLTGSGLWKIEFDYGQLDAAGLWGQEGGRRAFDYEFCLPDQDHVLQRILRIDPSLEIYQDSPGRIGCGEEEVLGIGNTHQENWRCVLEKLAEDPDIHKISQTFFE